MSNEQLANAALSLPPAERALLAESLWNSLADPFEKSQGDERANVDQAVERDREIENGSVAPVTHDEMIKRLRA